MLKRRDLLAAFVSTAAGALLPRAFGRPGTLPPARDVAVPAPRNDPDRGAYFQTTGMIGRVTDSDAVVNLVTAGNLPADGVLARVRWAAGAGELPDSPLVSPIVASTDPAAAVELPLADLEANEQYAYRVEYALAQTPVVWRPLEPIGTFRTRKSAGRSFHFCVTSDAHWGQTGPVPAAGARHATGVNCLRQIARTNRFDFALDLGDAPFPAVRSYAAALQKYVTYRDILAPLLATMPLYLALGNHECEAGFYQRGVSDADQQGPLWNQLSANQYRQLWATRARLIAIPNPRGDTYPEGGEGAPGYDSIDDWFGEPGPWNDAAPRTQLQNFYAWTWGDALFVVLDPFRATLPGSIWFPNSPAQYTLGAAQMQWLEDVLANSTATWKFLFAHHQVGGGLINRGGDLIEDGGEGYAYGRGSAIEAADSNTEQARIHELMLRHGAQFYVYGHDHAFSHSVLDGVHYVCCGRATFLNDWWHRAGMTGSYGNLLIQGLDQPWMRSLFNVIGYLAFEVEPQRVSMQWIRTGYSYAEYPAPIQQAVRDWTESWAGREYEVDSSRNVTVRLPPKQVDGVRTVDGAAIPDFYAPPTGADYYAPGGFLRSLQMHLGTIPLDSFPDSTAVVDAVPEVVYETTFTFNRPARSNAAGMPLP